MAQYAFGTGFLYGTRTDVTPATPVQFGAIQDITLDFAYTLKELYGQNQFPVTVARGPAKIEGKAKFGRIFIAAFNSLYFGQTITTGQTLLSNGEVASVPSSGPFTVNGVNRATFVADQGVVYAATGLPLTLVSGAPASIGQYAVSAGVYTFNTADSSANVLLSYTYTVASGQTISLLNQAQGSGPLFKAVLNTTYNGRVLTLTLNRCVASKLNFATKFSDFTIPEMDFQAMADDAGNIGTISSTE